MKRHFPKQQYLNKAKSCMIDDSFAEVLPGQVDSVARVLESNFPKHWILHRLLSLGSNVDCISSVVVKLSLSTPLLVIKLASRENEREMSGIAIEFFGDSHTVGVFRTKGFNYGRNSRVMDHLGGVISVDKIWELKTGLLVRVNVFTREQRGELQFI